MSVIDWFKNIKDKDIHSFISFDICEFYPSITEDLLDKAISWARQYVNIPDKQESIIKHARKSLLFNDGKTWKKRNINVTFDVSMGSYDGAEVCELVGLFILNSLSKKFGNDNVGLYRDDGLVLLKGSSKRIADKARKELHKLFKELQLRITADLCNQTVNFLDLNLNLKEGSYQPYRKPNNNLLFIDSHSNHTPSIIKQIPLSVNKRISQISSDQLAFLVAAPLYENALNQSYYQSNLKYTPCSNTNNQRKRRHRNIVWFDPPYSKSVRTNVGTEVGAVLPWDVSLCMFDN